MSISPSEEVVLENQAILKKLEEKGHLQTFKDVMPASLLEYYKDVIAECGMSNVLVVRLNEVFGKHCIYTSKNGVRNKGSMMGEMLPTELQQAT